MAKWLFSPLDAATRVWPSPPLGIEIDPLVLAASRAVVATLMLWASLAVRGRSHLRVRARDLPFLAAFGVVGLAMVHFSYFKAISLTNVATAILLEYMAPVIVLTLTVLFARHEVDWTLPAAVALSVGGCSLVVGAASGRLAVSPDGLLWGLAAAGFFAAYMLMGRWAAPRYSPWTLLGYGLASASLFWVIVLGGVRPIAEALSDSRTLLAVVYIAFASTIVPFGAFLAALKTLRAAEASIVSTLEPAIAAVGAWWFLGERITASQALGGALVIAGILVAQSGAAGREKVLPAP